MDMREEFEAWLASDWPDHAWSTKRYSVGEVADQYVDDFVQGAWVAWQAARRPMPDRAEAVPYRPGITGPMRPAAIREDGSVWERVSEFEWQPYQQERGEALFYYRPRSDGLYEGPLHRAAIEPVRRDSEQWVPLYPAPSGRVAELEAFVNTLSSRIGERTAELTDVRMVASDLRQQLAESEKAREGLREAVRGMLRTYQDVPCSALHHAKRDQHDSGTDCPVVARRNAAMEAAEAALAAEKGN